MTGSGTTDRPRGRNLRQKEANVSKARVANPTSTAIDRMGDSAPSGKAVRGGAHIPFLRTLAHDLRNPISGILAASQCLLEDASVFLDVPHVTLLRAIESSSDLMLHLIEDLLDVAQADSGRLRLRLRATDVTRLVRKCATIQQGRADARNIRLNVHVGENIPRAEIDAAKLRWALNALLANTIRSTEPGGVIEVQLASRRKNVVLFVRSSHSLNPGGATDFSSAFSRRGRLQASALTFSTARLIIEGHGGKLRVDPKATPPAYTLTLPRSEAQKPDTRHLKVASSGA